MWWSPLSGGGHGSGRRGGVVLANVSAGRAEAGGDAEARRSQRPTSVSSTASGCSQQQFQYRFDLSDSILSVEESPAGGGCGGGYGSAGAHVSSTDPYRLFSLPESRSPPTPFETARQRKAAERRRLKAATASNSSAGTANKENTTHHSGRGRRNRPRRTTATTTTITTTITAATAAAAGSTTGTLVKAACFGVVGGGADVVAAAAAAGGEDISEKYVVERQSAVQQFTGEELRRRGRPRKAPLQEATENRDIGKKTKNHNNNNNSKIYNNSSSRHINSSNNNNNNKEKENKTSKASKARVQVADHSDESLSKARLSFSSPAASEGVARSRRTRARGRVPKDRTLKASEGASSLPARATGGRRGQPLGEDDTVAVDAVAAATNRALDECCWDSGNDRHDEDNDNFSNDVPPHLRAASMSQNGRDRCLAVDSANRDPADVRSVVAREVSVATCFHDSGNPATTTTRVAASSNSSSITTSPPPPPALTMSTDATDGYSSSSTNGRRGSCSASDVGPASLYALSFSTSKSSAPAGAKTTPEASAASSSSSSSSSSSPPARIRVATSVADDDLSTHDGAAVPPCVKSAEQEQQESSKVQQLTNGGLNDSTLSGNGGHGHADDCDTGCDMAESQDESPVATKSMGQWAANQVNGSSSAQQVMIDSVLSDTDVSGNDRRDDRVEQRDESYENYENLKLKLKIKPIIGDGGGPGGTGATLSPNKHGTSVREQQAPTPRLWSCESWSGPSSQSSTTREQGSSSSSSSVKKAVVDLVVIDISDDEEQSESISLRPQPQHTVEHAPSSDPVAGGQWSRSTDSTQSRIVATVDNGKDSIEDTEGDDDDDDDDNNSSSVIRKTKQECLTNICAVFVERCSLPATAIRRKTTVPHSGRTATKSIGGTAAKSKDAATKPKGAATKSIDTAAKSKGDKSKAASKRARSRDDNVGNTNVHSIAKPRSKKRRLSDTTTAAAATTTTSLDGPNSSSFKGTAGVTLPVASPAAESQQSAEGQHLEPVSIVDLTSPPALAMSRTPSSTARTSDQSSPGSAAATSSRKHSQRGWPVTFARLSLASLFRRSFDRLEEKHCISHLPPVKPCVVQLERIDYEKVLPLVMPEYPVSFLYLFDTWDIEVVEKLGEGSFSEVFRVRKVEPQVDDGRQHEYVIKVVPVGKTGQPSFEDMLPEMNMSLAGRDLLENEINRAPTFSGLQGMHLAHGRYTEAMTAACHQYAAEKPHDWEHPLPEQRPADQYFIVFFTSYEGVDLEHVMTQLTLEQRCSLVLQVTLGLAAAEAAFDFEHRDLHLSNVVVSSVGGGGGAGAGETCGIEDQDQDQDGDDMDQIEFRVDGKAYWVRTFGKKVAFIDYGMSRLVVDETLYTSFSQSILCGRDLQRKTYREQHALVASDGGYRAARPETNGLWIKYLINKVIPRRPVNPKKAKYAAHVNRLYEALDKRAVCALDCLAILSDDLTQSA